MTDTFDVRFGANQAIVPYSGTITDAKCNECHGLLAFHGNAREGFTACQSCHTPAGWRGGTSGSFDHDLTRYPLAGLHQDVACQACHPAGRSHRRPFDRCTRCHVDTHRGELADRSDGGACEACHDVFGFRPSHFDVPDHRGTGFPLEGGHLAVPCDACHRQLRGTGLAARVDVRRNRRRSGSPPTLRLRFASTGCRDCHADPHAGGVDRYMAEESCEACHVLSSWRAPGAFDHSAVGYPLLGRHAQAACGGCHPGGEGRSSSAPVAFTGVAAGCHDCHEDPHRGQLSQSFSTSPCARCHTPDAWNALLFDHSRDSSYPLDGAHLNVECPACHRAEDRDGATVVRYKPLETTCVSCHGLRPVDAREGEP